MGRQRRQAPLAARPHDITKKFGCSYHPRLSALKSKAAEFPSARRDGSSNGVIVYHRDAHHRVQAISLVRCGAVLKLGRAGFGLPRASPKANTIVSVYKKSVAVANVPIRHPLVDIPGQSRLAMRSRRE